jgi:hypothetical protein
MPGFISDSPLARELIRIGGEAIAREDDAALRAYFAEDYVFHGPGGDLSFDQLSAYFAALRGAFSDLRIVREQIIVDCNFAAARNTFSGVSLASSPTSSILPEELATSSLPGLSGGSATKLADQDVHRLPRDHFPALGRRFPTSAARPKSTPSFCAIS